MRIELIKRADASPLFSIASPFIALLLTMIAGVIMFLLLGKDPATGLYTYFVQPLLDTWSLEQILVKATPLALIGIGLAVCFRSGNWNIGAEGQYLIGGAFGAALPVFLPGVDTWVLLPAMVLMGMLGGALYGAIPALLKTRFGANEILTSLMLVYVAQQLVDWLVRVPWRDPKGMGFPGTPSFPSGAQMPKLWQYADAHYGLVLAVVLAIIVWFVLSRTMKGFEIAVLGSSARAGRFAGFSARRMTIFAFCVSGALAGLAGIAEVSGTVGKLDDKLSLGYGFSAIIVAFLGRLNPLGCLAAAFVLALTYIGGENAQIAMGISDRATRVFQGLLLFFVLASDTLIQYQVRIVSTAARSA
ncbi:ABC transporter permease [Ahrensia sp. R2A130]|uniref:ABC transporter permease n=1 Tax=Ahrensia sp. R2A130 TaxID=744979 RepID=UPI0001E0D80B|nr:ABC transporter permease [Ahrensia sp. R2A130]EFL90331.1 inner-membrane translocator [Ahrensia sp. R2A130]